MTDALQKRQVIFVSNDAFDEKPEPRYVFKAFTVSMFLPPVLIFDRISVLCLRVFVIFKVNSYAEI